MCQHHAHLVRGTGGPGTRAHDPCASAQTAAESNQRRLGWMLGLVVVYLLAEVVGGVMSNSLALLADAGHMLSDAAALALSFFAIWVARRPARGRNTYGYHRTEILAALANGAALVAVSLWIGLEAVQRLRAPEAVDARLVAGVALGGLLVNLSGLWVLHGGARDSLNMRGAWLHVLSDALGSVAVLLSALLAWAYGWHWADPAISIVVAALVLASSWSLLREAVAVLMEAAPAHLDVDEVRGAILDQPGVLGVYRLHVWTITSGVVALSAHVATAEAGAPEMLIGIRRMLRERFDVEHITIQVEPEGAALDCCAAHRHHSRSSGLLAGSNHLSPAGT